MSKLGERIKKQRLAVHLTQEELANKLGYKSKSSINKIENGENDLPQSKISSFADALNTTPAYLMGWTDNNSAELSSDPSISDSNDDNYYGDHHANLKHLSDKPDLLHLYNEIYNNHTLQLLFDKTQDLSPEDLEIVLNLIDGYKKGKGLE